MWERLQDLLYRLYHSSPLLPLLPLLLVALKKKKISEETKIQTQKTD